jgi:ankyrin repeat protein
LDYILHFAEPYDAIEALSALPANMESAYVEIFDRIDKAKKPTVIKVLSWLFHAQRPLLKDELREAIAVCPGRTTLPKPLVHSDALIQYCQGLITLDEESEIIRFTHFTVREFLSPPQCQEELLSVVDLAKVCLTYLTFEVFEQGRCRNENSYEKRINDYRFSKYAIQFWGLYTRGRGEKDKTVLDALQKLFRSPQKRVAIHQLKLLIQPYPWTHSQIMELSDLELNLCMPLHMIANEGLSTVYDFICTAQVDASVHELDITAVRQRFQDIDLGTVHSRDIFNSTPLLEAARNGHSSMVNQLLKDGADVKAQDKDGLTALHLAAGHGHKDTMIVLLNSGADVKPQDKDGWTALHRAAWYGHKDTAIALLNSGADVKAQDKDGWTALHLAASYGHKDTATALLNSGADVKQQDKDGCTALHETSDDKQTDIEDILKALTTKFPNDALLLRALGNEYLRRMMSLEARNSFDASVHIKLRNGEASDVEGLEFNGIVCDGCDHKIRGYHYKCMMCTWDHDYCETCIKLNEHQHPETDIIMIPFVRPFGDYMCG